MYQIQQLSLGGILDQAINVLKNRFGLLMSIVMATVVPVQFLGGLIQLSMLPDMGPGAEPDPINLLLFGLASLVVGLVMLFIFPLANAAVIHGVASEYLSRPTTVGECLRHGLRRWPALVGTTILMFLIIVFGFILLIVPGIIFALWYFVAQQVTVLEDKSGTTALSRSKALMKGNMGTAFVLGLITFVINAAGTGVARLVPQVHLNLLAQSLVAGVSTVFGACVLVVFYFSCRCKAENFDLQVLADAVAEDA